MVHSYEIFLGFMLLNIIISLEGVIEYGFKLKWTVTWLLKRNNYGYRLLILRSVDGNWIRLEADMNGNVTVEKEQLCITATS